MCFGVCLNLCSFMCSCFGGCIGRLVVFDFFLWCFVCWYDFVCIGVIDELFLLIGVDVVFVCLV